MKIKVFISAPSDIVEEINAVKDICREIGKSEGIEITTFHYSEMRSKLENISAQEKIDQDLKNSHIVITIFGKKFGIPQENLNNQTPTQHEFYLAKKLYGKSNFLPDVSVFFKNTKGTTPDQGVSDLKQKFRDQEIGGIYKNFSTLEEFSKKAKDCLDDAIKNPNSPIWKRIALSKLTYPNNPDYIERNIYPIKDKDKSDLELYWSHEDSKKIPQIISKNKRILLLGDASVGKSEELKYLAQALKTQDPPSLVPYFVELKGYCGGDLNNFIKREYSEWDLNPTDALLIIDGYDEVQDEKKEEFYREFENFYKRFPNTFILVSCRSNFSSDELKSLFDSIYRLKSLSYEEVKKYLQKKLPQDFQSFYTEVEDKKLEGLLGNPMNLNFLIRLFEENRTLPKSKAEAYRMIVQSKIKESFQPRGVSFEENKEKVMEALEILAFSMEMLGKNIITKNEYLQIIVDSESQRLVEKSGIFEFRNSIGQFEHNTIQEYFAAKILAKQNLNFAQSVLRMPKPLNKKINPSWANTLSFLFSLDSKSKIVKWVLSLDDARLISKFEFKLFEKDLKFKIFKNEFERRKKHKVWLDRLFFGDEEMAQLINFNDKAIEYLIKETTLKNHYTTISNACSILEYVSLPKNKREIVKKIFLDLALNYKESEDVQLSAVYGLLKQKFYKEKDVINLLLENIKSANSHVRSAMYKLLGKTNAFQDNIDMFIEMIPVASHSSFINDQINLKYELIKVVKPEPLKKLLNYIAENSKQADDILYEDQINQIVENSISAFKEDSSVLETYKKFFSSISGPYSFSRIKDKNELIQFFEKTKTKLTYFEELLIQDIDDAIVSLTDKECINFFIKKYKKGDLQDDLVLDFRNHLSWRNSKYFDYFYEEIQKLTKDDRFLLPPQTEPPYQERVRRNFDLFFDKNELVKHIESIFKDKEELTYEEIDKIHSDHFHNGEPFSNSILVLLINSAKDSGIIKLDDMKKFFLGENSESFVFGKILKRMCSHEFLLPLKDDQKQMIVDWCNKRVKQIDYKKALWNEGKTTHSNRYALFISKFWKILEFDLAENILLDMLSFDSRYYTEKGYVDFDFLETKLPLEKMKKQVIKNLKNNSVNLHSFALSNHANFCKKHFLIEGAEYLEKEILNDHRDEFDKSRILDPLLEIIGHDENRLRKLLSFVKGNLILQVAKKLEKNATKNDRNIIFRAFKNSKDDDFRLQASETLLKMQDHRGMDYILDLLKNTNEKKDLYKIRHSEAFSSITNSKLTKKLIKLLKLGYSNPNISDDIVGLARNGLKSIALQSDKSYLKVKIHLNWFLFWNKKKIKNVNFLFLFTEDLDVQFCLNKLQVAGIREIKKTIKKLQV